MPARYLGFQRATAAALLLIGLGATAHASENAAVFHDTETKGVFGFTEGSGVGEQGEKSFEIETEANFGKRDGRYWASETQLEYEFTQADMSSSNSVLSSLTTPSTAWPISTTATSLASAVWPGKFAISFSTVVRHHRSPLRFRPGRNGNALRTAAAITSRPRSWS